MLISVLRSLVVWAITTTSCGVVATWSLTAPATTDDTQALLIRGAGWALTACAAWCWVVATLVIAEAARGTSTHSRVVPAWARHAVLVACGLALVTAGPTMATTGSPGSPAVSPTSGGPVVAGLRLPDRTTGPAHAARSTPTALPTRASWAALVAELVVEPPLVVRPDDNLWSLSTALLGPHATATEVADFTERLYLLNRDVVGPDPDLILPGQRLRVPDPDPGPDPDPDPASGHR